MSDRERRVMVGPKLHTISKARAIARCIRGQADAMDTPYVPVTKGLIDQISAILLELATDAEILALTRTVGRQHGRPTQAGAEWLWCSACGSEQDPDHAHFSSGAGT